MINKQSVLRHLSNLPGWRTKLKIVVLESDDWGSIRMSSNKSFETLQKKGLNLIGGDSLRYNSFDTLESAEDLQLLCKTLQAFQNKDGSHPVFTPLSLVTNPDFDKIRSNKFEAYHYEPFTVTLDKYQRAGTFEMYRQGIRSKLFIPQFHGREHLNVATWMRALQRKEPQTMAAFDEGIWGFRNNNSNKINYQAAFDLEFGSDINSQMDIISDGLSLFKNLHGYAASFFVPPNGPINNALEETAANNGIQYMSVQKIQHEVLGEGKTRKLFHWLGQQNKWQQTYITRNCFFEPSMKGKDWVASCLGDIRSAFLWHKPAVISTHRVNYVGSLNEENRKNGLGQLKRLLTEIMRNWPGTIFLTSNKLGDLIKGAALE